MFQKPEFSLLLIESRLLRRCRPHPLPAKRETRQLPSDNNQGLGGDTEKGTPALVDARARPQPLPGHLTPPQRILARRTRFLFPGTRQLCLGGSLAASARGRSSSLRSDPAPDGPPKPCSPSPSPPRAGRPGPPTLGMAGPEPSNAGLRRRPAGRPLPGRPGPGGAESRGRCRSRSCGGLLRAAMAAACC